MTDEFLATATGVPESAPVATTPAPASDEKKRPKQPARGTPERKEYNRNATKKSREKKAARSAKESRNWNSLAEIKSKDASDILINERNIRNLRIADVCVELAEVAARNLKIPFNRYLFTHGIQQTLLAREQKTEVEPPSVEDVWNPGSRIRLHEEYALWDYSMSWRTQTDGEKLSFEKFRQLRKVCVEDVYRFGNEILGLDFHPEPHGKWATELFVQKHDLLPEQYTQEDIKRALGKLSPIHQRLLISARNSYKSSYNLVDMLSWVLCFGGDLRIAMYSATQPLSRGFIKKFRSYFAIKNPNEPSLFNQLYPEHMIAPDEGVSSSYTSPMRRLDLIQPTLTSASIISEGQAGERADLIVFEDVAEISNSSTPEQRAKTLEKFDMLCELLEPTGFLQVIGTPISSGTGQEDDPGDIYSVLLKRESEREEKRMLWTICPAWTVKDGVNKLPYDSSLTEDEVILLFPSRLTFKLLKGKLKDNVRVYRQQSLCSWVPDDEDQIKLHFDRDILNACVVPLTAIPPGKVVLSLDVSFSVNAKADLTSICAGSVYEDSTNRRCLGILDLDAERMRGSEIALKIVIWSRRFNPSVVLIEASPISESLRMQVNLWASKYEMPPPPLHFVQVSNQKDRKILAIKNLEYLVSQNRLKFGSGIYLEALFQELQRLDGAISLRSRRDDRADSIAQICSTFRLFSDINGNKPPEENPGQMERIQQNAKIKAMSERYFGQDFRPTKVDELPPVLEADPRFAQANRIFGSTGLAAYRRRGQS